MTMREPAVDSDTAVSPVVGMILVLAISIVGIAAILYWGLPAIDEMKANVEHKSVQAQFDELDSTIKELVAGTTEKTAKRWQPSMNRGQINIAGEKEGWIYEVIPYQGYTKDGTGATAVDITKSEGFIFSGFTHSPPTNTISIYNMNRTNTNPSIHVWRVNGTASSTELTVAGTSYPSGQWPVGNTQTISLTDPTSTPPNALANLYNITFHFVIYNGTRTVAEAWYIPTGSVDYRLTAGVSEKTVSENNGAVITGAGGQYTLANSPPIPPAANTTGTMRMFARGVLINGTSSFGGNDRFNVLVTLYSTITLANGYDCAKADHSDCAEGAYIFNDGNYQGPWFSYLTSSGRGYNWQKPGPTNGETYLYHREGWMGYTLLQSTVVLNGST